MDKLKDIILENNKKLINYTHRMKTDKDLKEFILKIAINSKYNDFVFLLDVNKLDKKLINSLVCSGMIQNIITNDLILLFNRDMFIHLYLNSDFNKLNVIKFLDHDSFNCCICLDDNITVIACFHCNAMYCEECIKKVSNCSVCRQNIYNIIKVNIDDIVEM